MNAYKAEKRRQTIVKAYQANMRGPEGAPLMVRTMGEANTYRPITTLSVVNTKIGKLNLSGDLPRSRMVKSGKRVIRRIKF